MHKARYLSGEGFSQIEIAQRLGVSDRMVRKYLRPDYQHKSRAKRTSQLDPFTTDINMILEEKPFFNLTVLAKQLRSKGYSGGMTILRDYAAEVRKQVLTKAVLRFETEPGRQAQVDWKECGRWIVGANLLKVYAFVMLLGYSRKPFVLFTSSMTSSVLLAAHSQAFKFYGGIPRELLYDNMKTAWIAEGSHWKVNEVLEDYSVQLGFEPKRCQVRRPQTKGKVERFIGYLGNHFLPLAREKGLQTIEELNAAIGPWLAEVDEENLREFCQTRGERFEQEKSHLRPWLPQAAPDIHLSVDLTVSREGLVTYETNRYSVSAEYLGRIITLRINPLSRSATFLYQGKILHERMLEPAGLRRKLISPEDAKSLNARWEKENRPTKVSVLARTGHPQPPEDEREDIPVEIRTPGFYDQFTEVSA